MSAPEAGQPTTLLITGAAGRVGAALVRDLRTEYALKPTDIRAGEQDGLPVEALDITDFDATLAAMAGVDMVVHSAIATPTREQRLTPSTHNDAIMRVNVMGTQHVFEAARLQGVKRMVFLSSMTVYLGEPRFLLVDRKTPLRPKSLYACTKLFGERLGEMYARQFGLPTVCLRLGQPYPTPPQFPLEDLRRPRSRRFAVSFEDVAGAVRCALDPDGPDYAVANIVSDSDTRATTFVGGDRIGFRPRTYFTEDGPVPVEQIKRPQSTKRKRSIEA